MQNRATLKILLLSVLLAPALAGAQGLRPEDIYQKVLPSVMTLHVENAQGETFVGTAFLALEKNTAVTAWHVVSDAVRVSAKFSDEETVEVYGLVDKDEVHDLALIRLEAAARPQLCLGVTNPPVGSRAYVIGAPKGYDFSITDGLLSQIQKIHGCNQYQVSCPISPGNSGGPVVNDLGLVMGVTAWSKRDAQNLNFAIPASFLPGLNPRLPALAWKENTGHSFTKAATAQTVATRARDNHKESGNDIAAFKQLLGSFAGQQITVTVDDQGRARTFKVVVPAGIEK